MNRYYRVLATACALVFATSSSIAGAHNPNDARLRQHVSVHQTQIELGVLLKQLSVTTHVDMRADNEVAYYRASVAVRDLPLIALQNRLAEAYHLTWRSAGTDTARPAYVLYASPRDRAVNPDLGASENIAFKNVLEAAVRGLSAPKEELDREWQSRHPAHITLLNSPRNRMIPELYSRLDLAQKQELLRGKPITIAYADLPEAVRTLAEPEFGIGERHMNPPNTLRFSRTGFGAMNLIGIAVIGNGWGSSFNVGIGFTGSVYRTVSSSKTVGRIGT